MTVQDLVKRRILFADGSYNLDMEKTDKELYERVRKSMYISYAWGVFCTAAARTSLQDGIKLVGKDNCVYVDTDSVKFRGNADFTKYNDERIAECLKSGIYADDPNGVTHYAGVYEYDGFMPRFRSWGAKKYAYEDEKGKLHITVSGVSKKQGAEELAAHGGLEAFEPGFVFQNSGKTESKYNDDKKITLTRIDGQLVQIGRNVVIRDVPYTLSLADDYTACLEVSSNMLNKVLKFYKNCQLQ